MNKHDRSMVERSVPFLLLGLICIFTLNSIGNVQKYVSQYHNYWTGDTLGIAFGTVVFVCAYIAATTGGHTHWVAVKKYYSKLILVMLLHSKYKNRI